MLRDLYIQNRHISVKQTCGVQTEQMWWSHIDKNHNRFLVAPQKMLPRVGTLAEQRCYSDSYTGCQQFYFAERETQNRNPNWYTEYLRKTRVNSHESSSVSRREQ